MPQVRELSQIAIVFHPNGTVGAAAYYVMSEYMEPHPEGAPPLFSNPDPRGPVTVPLDQLEALLSAETARLVHGISAAQGAKDDAAALFNTQVDRNQQLIKAMKAMEATNDYLSRTVAELRAEVAELKAVPEAPTAE